MPMFACVIESHAGALLKLNLRAQSPRQSLAAPKPQTSSDENLLVEAPPAHWVSRPSHQLPPFVDAAAKSIRRLHQNLSVLVGINGLVQSLDVILICASAEDKLKRSHDENNCGIHRS